VTRALPWWKRTTVYQIYPRSFADANGDGVGDLAGIIDRLDYLEWLGVETVWLSPFFRSPQADFGYDISDHFDVAPEYGSLHDCRRLIDEIHARGMKVVLDMVLNHTSAEHPWFLSREARARTRGATHIWRDGRRPRRRASEQLALDAGGSGWHYDPATDQWYWASFLPFQPDLNYRNPAVKQAMLDVVRHWLREGADGFRLDIFNAIHKDPSFADNPFSLRPIPSEENPDGFFQRPIHTQNHPDTFAFARGLRAVVDGSRPAALPRRWYSAPLRCCASTAATPGTGSTSSSCSEPARPLLHARSATWCASSRPRFPIRFTRRTSSAITIARATWSGSATTRQRLACWPRSS
jgi:oligo-1,6-glucosidase/alpha-glucosidase